MLRVVLMDNIDMMQSILSGSASMDATFLGEKNQHLNSVCFDTATHEVTHLLSVLLTVQPCSSCYHKKPLSTVLLLR
jgi:hypothetical protein